MPSCYRPGTARSLAHNSIVDMPPDQSTGNRKRMELEFVVIVVVVVVVRIGCYCC